MFDGGEWRGPGSAVVAGNQNDVSVSLGYSGCNCPYSRFGYQFNGDLGAWVDFLQIMNELGEILNGVDVMMRRR